MAGAALYVLGEMGHSVAAFPIPKQGQNVHTPLWEQSYLPPSVPAEYTTYMDGAEIVLHPQHSVVYASNRLELQAAEKNNLPPRPAESGDAVAIIQLSEDGRSVRHTDWVRTGCDTVRGMQVSPDGKYVAVAGQNNAVVEIYALSNNGTKWSKAASLEVDGITDFVWM
jgi:6-phosphogluconolactonase (cycloisomerase 2 family)